MNGKNPVEIWGSFCYYVIGVRYEGGNVVKLNDFENMCKQLGQTKCRPICKNNNYICAKNVVELYVGNDKNKLLSLKSEANGGSFSDLASNILSLSALLVSFATFVFSISGEALGIVAQVIVMALVGIVVLGGMIGLSAFAGVYKWGPYIITAIKEVEKEKFSGKEE